MKARPWTSVVLLLGAMATLIVFLETGVMPSNSLQWRSITNSGHIPLFGLLSLILLRLIRTQADSIRSGWMKPYLLAFGIATLLGALSEFFQIVGPRDADPWDWIRDVVGSVAFLGLYALIDPRIAGYRASWGRLTRSSVVILSAVILMAGVVPVGIVVLATAYRDNSFPVICTFDTYWETPLLRTEEAELEIVKPPADWPKPAGDRVARITFQAATYPNFYHAEPNPFWGIYDSLTLEVFSGLDSTIQLTLRIEDSLHNNEFEDRFSVVLRIAPGVNRVSIPLEQVRHAPAGRQMDMTAISGLILYAVRPQRPFTVYLDNIKLD